MAMHLQRLLLTLAVCLGLSTGDVRAGFISNLGEGVLGQSQVHATHWLAQSFTLDNFNYTLTKVTLGLSSANSGGGNFVVQIRNDAAGSPGSTILATLSGNADPSGGGNEEYLGNVILSASQTYYVVAGVTSGSGTYNWNGTSSDIQTGDLAWTIGDGLFASNGTAGVVWNTTNSTANLVRLDATVAVPEPSTMALGAISLVGAFTARRLRRGRTIPITANA